MLGTNVMEGSNKATFQDAKIALDGVGMNRPSNIFPQTMFYNIVFPKLGVQTLIGFEIIPALSAKKSSLYGPNLLRRGPSWSNYPKRFHRLRQFSLFRQADL